MNKYRQDNETQVVWHQNDKRQQAVVVIIDCVYSKLAFRYITTEVYWSLCDWQRSSKTLEQVLDVCRRRCHPVVVIMHFDCIMVHRHLHIMHQ